ERRSADGLEGGGEAVDAEPIAHADTSGGQRAVDGAGGQAEAHNTSEAVESARAAFAVEAEAVGERQVEGGGDDTVGSVGGLGDVSQVLGALADFDTAVAVQVLSAGGEHGLAHVFAGVE